MRPALPLVLALALLAPAAAADHVNVGNGAATVHLLPGGAAVGSNVVPSSAWAVCVHGSPSVPPSAFCGALASGTIAGQTLTARADCLLVHVGSPGLAFGWPCPSGSVTTPAGWVGAGCQPYATTLPTAFAICSSLGSVGGSGTFAWCTLWHAEPHDQLAWCGAALGSTLPGSGPSYVVLMCFARHDDGSFTATLTGLCLATLQRPSGEAGVLPAAIAWASPGSVGGGGCALLLGSSHPGYCAWVIRGGADPGTCLYVLRGTGGPQVARACAPV